MRLISKCLGAVFALCAALVVAASLAAPLDAGGQFVFGGVFVVAALASARAKTRRATAMLCLLALFTSTRYMIWRATHTLEFHSVGDGVLGVGLFLAECYTWLVMLLSIVQSAWPMRRPVRLMERDPQAAPSVDVYIPTYNESLSVVAPAVLAALEMDYPKDRFRVFLLDDGDRPEFARFAEQAGCGYLTRADNQHAKAGNLNAAMKVTDGELICIFDCDHVATRAFLQMTVGWFQADPKLALVQTPHFFYSPDPIQRNLRLAKDMPGEGDLFYDVIQRGNDLWNAAFFCGSCAIIRREAIESVGGFAFETVTEDAHTALKMHRRGWNSAFLNMRLSAGLATETLNQHIAQRVRWCRGMTQILRLDNPLFGRGLKLPQRLCYLNALLYYQFPLIRVAFLLAPLAYLFFGVSLINAPALLVLAYAAPHMLLGQITNQRLQGRLRGLFWGEIYETILAFHLVRPALLSLFSPRAGKFNVTDKGQLLEHGYFDVGLVRPHLFTAGLLLAGVAFAAAKLCWPDVFHMSLGTLLINMAWTSFNLMILFTAVAVGREARQIRAHVRRPLSLPVTLYFDDGRVMDAVTENISTGGLAVNLPAAARAGGRTVVDVSFPIPGSLAALPVKEVAQVGDSLRLQFQVETLAHRRLIVRALMGRADAWQPEPERARTAAWISGLLTVAGTSALTARFVAAAGLRLLNRRRATPAAAGLGLVVALGEAPGAARAAEPWTSSAALSALDLQPHDLPALAAQTADVWANLQHQSWALAGLAIFALGVLATAMAAGLQGQVRRRLGDLEERAE